jgi:hypothetical protein
MGRGRNDLITGPPVTFPERSVQQTPLLITTGTLLLNQCLLLGKREIADIVALHSTVSRFIPLMEKAA